MTDWYDKAKNQYKEHKAAWDAAVAEMNNILTAKAAPALNAMVDNVEQTERKHTMMWQQ
jgi:hypothetical protein